MVHGADHLDEISTTGNTIVLEIRSGAIAQHTLTPKDFGLKRSKLSELKGGDSATNVAIAQSILAGEEGPKRDIVLANASAALVAAGKAADFLAGVQMAAESIDSGKARAKVEALVEFSQR